MRWNATVAESSSTHGTFLPAISTSLLDRDEQSLLLLLLSSGSIEVQDSYKAELWTVV